MNIFAPLGLSVILITGCTPSHPTLPPEVTSYRSPADGHTGIRRSRYQRVITGYTKRPVVEPEGWRQQNAVPEQAPVVDPAATGAPAKKPSGWTDQNVEPTPVPESKT